MSPEEREDHIPSAPSGLILGDPIAAALRVYFGMDAAVDQALLPRSEDDWRQFIARMGDHCCTGLVLGSLRASGAAIHPEVEEAMRRQVISRGTRSTVLTEELRHLLEMLERCGIEVLCVKGPMLARLAFGDACVREFDDLDLLVRAGDFTRAVAALERHGYARERDVDTAVHICGGWDCTFRNRCKGHFAEVSVIGMPRYFMHIAEPDLWRDPLVVDVAGAPCPAPSLAAQLILLSAHGAKHGWCRYMWVADIAGLITRDDIEWEGVFALARRTGTARMLRVALVLANEVCGVPLPAAVAEFIEHDFSVPWIVEGCLRALAEGDARQPAGLAAIRLHLRCRERLRDRLRYLVLLAVLPGFSDWKDNDLPHYWMYFLRRPLRLLRGLGGRLRDGAL